MSSEPGRDLAPLSWFSHLKRKQKPRSPGPAVTRGSVSVAGGRSPVGMRWSLLWAALFPGQACLPQLPLICTTLTQENPFSGEDARPCDKLDRGGLIGGFVAELPGPTKASCPICCGVRIPYPTLKPTPKDECRPPRSPTLAFSSLPGSAEVRASRRVTSSVAPRLEPVADGSRQLLRHSVLTGSHVPLREARTC